MRHMDAQTLGQLGHLRKTDRHQLGAAERPAHANCEQCPVAQAADAVAIDCAQHVTQDIAVSSAFLRDRLVALIGTHAAHRALKMLAFT
ncbi:hypothetical protein GCM10020258_56560 [Sphingomonas yabuuchiae]